MHDSIGSVSFSTGWMAGQVRRAARNSLIWNGVVLLLVALVAWLSSTYYYHFFFGPFPYNDARVLKAAENPGTGGLLAYIDLLDHQLLETGVKNVMTQDGKPLYSTPYFMTPVGDKMMIVMSEDEGDGKHLVGPLSKVGKLEEEVIADLEAHR